MQPSQRRTPPSAPQPSTQQRRYDPLAVLDYIERQHHTGQPSPSQRQIAEAMNLSGRSAASRIIEQLVRRALLTSYVHARGWPAILTVTEIGEEALHDWRAQQPDAGLVTQPGGVP